MAVPGSARAIFLNSGQICTTGSRLIVLREMKDEVPDVWWRSPLGDPMNPGTKLGRLVSQE
jgi:acyl-CoA reductase-like NAD-dependent aldehyde dehydrogenase